jgi:hypothetical protein
MCTTAAVLPAISLEITYAIHKFPIGGPGGCPGGLPSSKAKLNSQTS